VLTANRLFPTPPTASAIMTPGKKEPEDPESTAEGEIQSEYCCDYLCTQTTEAERKFTC